MRPGRYPAHTVPQPGVEMYTRNVGHGQHAGRSREAPGGNKGRCGSTLRQSNATMGGQEFKDGSKMVRGPRISLSTDSQGRDLLLIPPGSDGFGMQEMVDKVNTLP